MLKVLIIGGTSGIGRSLASVYRTDGHRVTVVGRTRRPTDPVGIEAVTADLSLRTGQDHVLAQLGDGPLDRLVFTAGWLSARARTTQEGEDATWMVHHVARKRITEALLPRMSVNGAVGFVSGWGAYRTPPPADYPFGKTGLAGIGHVMKTLMTNEPLFDGFSKQRPDVRFIGYYPGPTKHTELAKRPDAPGILKLLQPIIRIVGRPVEVVSREFFDIIEGAGPGISWHKTTKRLPRPPFLELG